MKEEREEEEEEKSIKKYIHHNHVYYIECILKQDPMIVNYMLFLCLYVEARLFM